MEGASGGAAVGHAGRTNDVSSILMSWHPWTKKEVDVGLPNVPEEWGRKGGGTFVGIGLFSLNVVATSKRRNIHSYLRSVLHFDVLTGWRHPPRLHDIATVEPQVENVVVILLGGRGKRLRYRSLDGALIGDTDVGRPVYHNLKTQKRDGKVPSVRLSRKIFFCEKD